MLQKLTISNFAIIDRLEIDFGNGLHVLTGETGAGKSIIMVGLGLILGNRAEASSIKDADKKSVIEATFLVKDDGRFSEFYADNDLDEHDQIIVRRELSAAGKSRSFINDTPVNLAQLRALSVMLVDLHQQFETLELGEKDFQRNVLDAYAGTIPLRKELEEKFASYSKLYKELTAVVAAEEAAKKEQDYNQFLFDELEALALKENELEDLDQELVICSNADTIKAELTEIYNALLYEEPALLTTLKQHIAKLTPLLAFDPSLESLQKRMQSSMLDLEDVAAELEQIETKVERDEERMHVINDRIAEGYRLQKKHAVQGTAPLLELQAQLSEKLETLETLTTSKVGLESKVLAAEKAAKAIAEELSKKRTTIIKVFEKELQSLLVQVGMPNARLTIDIKTQGLVAHGIDDINFLFDANKSGKPQPIEKVASGGELSRLMLTIKSMVASKLALPTLIFDEIDSGISGEAAKQVGIIMKRLSTAHQLIVISHQPQIAAMANTNLMVYKTEEKGKVHTGIRRLEAEEKIEAIAKMLSGEKPTAAALSNAREMVEGS